MVGTYQVYFEGIPVGTVCLTKWGLYYELECHCQKISDEMMELVTNVKDDRKKLGLLLPSDEGLMLRKRIPAKDLGEGKGEFFLVPRNSPIFEQVPVDPQNPFPYLQKLPDAFLTCKDGQPMIGFKSKKSKI